MVEFGDDRTKWLPGRRDEDTSRATAAWLARRKFGYKVCEIAEALGYTSHGGAVTAIRRMEDASDAMGRTLTKLGRRLTND